MMIRLPGMSEGRVYLDGLWKSRLDAHRGILAGMNRVGLVIPLPVGPDQELHLLLVDNHPVLVELNWIACGILCNLLLQTPLLFKEKLEPLAEELDRRIRETCDGIDSSGADVLADGDCPF